MNAIERRQYEMLLRIRDFANTNSHVFASSPIAQEAFASVSAAVDELTATDLLKMSASASARADRKAVARKALAELLVKASQLARVLRARGQTLPSFALPASKSDQACLTAGRQFARDAAAFETDFKGHGIGSKLIADTAARFEAAVRDRGMKRADHMAARTRIHDLLTAALLDVRRLDLIVDNELAGDNVIRAVWKQARRVEDPRGPRGGGGAEPPAPTDAAAVTPPVAEVIPMPTREAA